MTHLELAGVRFTVGTDDRQLRSDVERLWAACVIEDIGSTSSIRVVLETEPLSRMWIDGDLVAQAPGAAQLIVEFARVANRLALASCVDFAVHAGVVSAGSTAVAFPASSGVGKSTLMAACVRRGLGYMSDEALRVSYDDALVSPYPRPVGLSAWSARAVGLTTAPTSADELLIAPSALGAVAHARLPLADVVVLRRDGGSQAVLSQLHRADAAEVLLRLSFNHFFRPRDAFDLVCRTLPSVQTWVLTYSDVQSAADLVIARFGRPSLVDKILDS